MTVATTYWRDLIVETVFSPGSAARKIMMFRLRPEAIWTSLLLVGVLNTIMFSLTNIMVPASSFAALNSPIVVLLFVIAELGLSTLAIYWAGRFFGGTGALGEILLLMIWLQVLQVLIQAAVMAFLIVTPDLAIVFTLAANLLSLWILVNFVNAVHHLNSLMRAALVLVAAVVGLSLILSLLGVSILGSIIHV